MVGKALLAIVLAIAAVLGMFYVARSNMLDVAVQRATGSAEVNVSTSNEVSIPNKIEVNHQTAIDIAKMVIYGAISVGQKFAEFVAETVRGENLTQTIINGAILSAVFFVLGYLSVVLAKLIRFLFYAAGIFTAGITMMYVLGLIG